MALVKVLSIPGKVAKMKDVIAFDMCERFPKMYELVSQPKVTVEVLKEHIVTNGLPKKKEDVAEVKHETIEKSIERLDESKPQQIEMTKHPVRKRKRKRKTKK